MDPEHHEVQSEAESENMLPATHVYIQPQNIPVQWHYTATPGNIRDSL